LEDLYVNLQRLLSSEEQDFLDARKKSRPGLGK
jgi:hypothetical protein